MRNKTLLATLILALLLALCCAAPAIAAETRTQPLDLTGVIPTEAVQEIQGWSWNAVTRTLTLNGVDFAISSGDYALLLPSMSCKIVVNGENNISLDTTAAGVRVIRSLNGNIGVSGSGTLNINGCNHRGSIVAMEAAGGSIVQSAAIVNIDVSSDGSGAHGLWAKNSVSLTGGEMHIKVQGNGFQSFGLYCDGAISSAAASALTVEAINNGAAQAVGVMARDALMLNGRTAVKAQAALDDATAIFCSKDLTAAGTTLNVSAQAQDNAYGIRCLGNISFSRVTLAAAADSLNTQPADEQSGDYLSTGVYAARRLQLSDGLVEVNAAAKAGKCYGLTAALISIGDCQSTVEAAGSGPSTIGVYADGRYISDIVEGGIDISGGELLASGSDAAIAAYGVISSELKAATGGDVYTLPGGYATYAVNYGAAALSGDGVTVSGSASVALLSTLRFTDVLKNHWAYDYISDIVDKGITTGTTATTFSPEDGLTRAQFVVFLGRYAGIDPAAYLDATPFPDDETHTVQLWSKGYINWAAAGGVTNGVSATSFGPDLPLTHEQVAAMVYRYAQNNGLSLTRPGHSTLAVITDFAAVSEWAAEAVPLLVNNGYMRLDSDSRFDPQGVCTRAEMAQLLSLLP
ncbi:MAG: S-layer homology domain-containing protein [Bacillota bacterium]|nr:S-layer homology domain-containing protein [Bacillota bacterium]